MLKPYSRTLSAEVNIGYFDLATQVAFLGKSQTYDSCGIEEWYTQLSGSYAITHPHTVCSKCRPIWWVISEFPFLVTVWPWLAIFLDLEYNMKSKLEVATLMCYLRAKIYTAQGAHRNAVMLRWIILIVQGIISPSPYQTRTIVFNIYLVDISRIKG